jgi:hypothetical protein
MVARFRRRKPGFRRFDASELESPRPTSLEHALDEGLMISAYATRLALRNAITVSALRNGEPFTARGLLPDARRVLQGLVDESLDEARRAAADREWASHLEGPSEHIHDYRPVDDLNLRRREALSLALADALADRMDDETYLLDLIERARDDAWFDIARSIEDRLGAAAVASESDPADRLMRIQEFIEIDLQALIDTSATGSD